MLLDMILLTGVLLVFLVMFGYFISLWWRYKKLFKLMDAWNHDVGAKVSRFLKLLPKDSDVRESFVRSIGFQYFDVEKYHKTLFREGYYLAPFFILPYGSMKDFEILVVKDIQKGDNPFDVGIRLTYKNEEWRSRVSEYMDLVLERAEGEEDVLMLFADAALENLRIQRDLEESIFLVESFEVETEHAYRN